RREPAHHRAGGVTLLARRAPARRPRDSTAPPRKPPGPAAPGGRRRGGGGAGRRPEPPTRRRARRRRRSRDARASARRPWDDRSSMLVVTLGDLLLDVIVRLHEPLAAGADVNAETRPATGGQAANVGAWVTALGGKARCVVPRGSDAAGAWIAADL